MMFGVFSHLLFVLLCMGLGYALRVVIENMAALDQQVDDLQKPEVRSHTGGLKSQHSMSTVLQSKADPVKLAALRSSLKK